MFSPESVAELPEPTKINNHLINLKKGKQLPSSLIYSLESVELKTLKTYIKANLKNSFIRLFKLSPGAPILFVRKRNSSFRLSVDY